MRVEIDDEVAALVELKGGKGSLVTGVTMALVQWLDPGSRILFAASPDGRTIPHAEYLKLIREQIEKTDNR